MNKDFDIKAITTYQAVKLDGKLESFYCVRPVNHRKQVTFKLVEGIGVIVSSDADSMIVPFPNISAIYLNTEENEKIYEDRKADRDKPAKAQKVTRLKSDPIGAKRL